MTSPHAPPKPAPETAHPVESGTTTRTIRPRTPQAITETLAIHLREILDEQAAWQ
ncbi:hypothetical protein [Nocardia sp. NPDC058705]|uniref:hypothetical protein n=1 Tax=Nocardia sp. NPDC058705 TaxID=3346609 RepID=UPI003678C9BC